MVGIQLQQTSQNPLYSAHFFGQDVPFPIRHLNATDVVSKD